MPSAWAAGDLLLNRRVTVCSPGVSAISRCVAIVDDAEYKSLTKKAALPKTKFGDVGGSCKSINKFSQVNLS